MAISSSSRAHTVCVGHWQERLFKNMKTSPSAGQYTCSIFYHWRWSQKMSMGILCRMKRAVTVCISCRLERPRVGQGLYSVKDSQHTGYTDRAWIMLNFKSSYTVCYIIKFLTSDIWTSHLSNQNTWEWGKMHSATSVYLWIDLPALLIEETKESLGTKRRSQPFRSHYPFLFTCWSTFVKWTQASAGLDI